MSKQPGVVQGDDRGVYHSSCMSPSSPIVNTAVVGISDTSNGANILPSSLAPSTLAVTPSAKTYYMQEIEPTAPADQYLCRHKWKCECTLAKRRNTPISLSALEDPPFETSLTALNVSPTSLLFQGVPMEISDTVPAPAQSKLLRNTTLSNDITLIDSARDRTARNKESNLHQSLQQCEYAKHKLDETLVYHEP